MENTTRDINIYEDEIVRDVMKALVEDSPRSGEITITRIRDITGASYRHTYDAAERAVAKGFLKHRMVREDGHRAWAYSPADGHTWKDVLEQLRS